MTTLHICALSESEQEALLAMYATACLYGEAAVPAVQALRRQIMGCPACAAEAASLLSLLRWRETERPFNRNTLPVPPDLARSIGVGAGKGAA